MATVIITNATNNRVRTGGSTNNSAGFDPTVTFISDGTILLGTSASPTLSSTSYNFVATDVGAYVFLTTQTNVIAGWYQIASVASNTATLTTTIGSVLLFPIYPGLSLNTTTGCATTATISGTVTWGVDYSQQDAAQLTFNGSTIMMSNASASQTVIITSTTIVAGNNWLGNTIHITGGTNFNTGYGTITSCSPGITGVGTITFGGAINATTAAGTGGTGYLGGGKALPSQIAAVEQPGNTCFILSGTNAVTFPASGYPTTVDYTETGYPTLTSGSTTTGAIRWIADPLGVMPTITSNGLYLYNASYRSVWNLYLTAYSSSNGTIGIIGLNTSCIVSGCIVSCQDRTALGAIQINSGVISNNDIYGGSTTPSAQSNNCYGIQSNNSNQGNICIIGNRIRYMRDNGIVSAGIGSTISQNIVYGCKNDGIRASSALSLYTTSVMNNTVDTNTQNGINLSTTATISNCNVFNNIITSNAVGINLASGNTSLRLFIDYNNVYNNTSNYSAITVGPHGISLNPQYTTAGVDWTPLNMAMQAAFNPSFLNTSGNQNYGWLGAITPRAIYVINQNIYRTFFEEGDFNG